GLIAARLDALSATDRSLASLLHPGLVEQDPAHNDRLVVPQPGGDEVASLVDERDPQAEVGGFPVDLGPFLRRSRWIRRLEGASFIDQRVVRLVAVVDETVPGLAGKHPEEVVGC